MFLSILFEFLLLKKKINAVENQTVSYLYYYLIDTALKSDL